MGKPRYIIIFLTRSFLFLDSLNPRTMSIVWEPLQSVGHSAYFCPINEQTDFNHISLASTPGQALTSYLKCLPSWTPFCFHMLELYISLVFKVINTFIQNLWFCLFVLCLSLCKNILVLWGPWCQVYVNLWLLHKVILWTHIYMIPTYFSAKHIPTLSFFPVTHCFLS